MKTYIAIAAATLNTLLLAADPQVDSTPSEAERLAAKAKLSELLKRENYGDKAAVAEAATLRPEFAIPFLESSARDKSTDPERAEIARKALAGIKGVEDYYVKKLNALLGRQDFKAASARSTIFGALSLIRTKKVILIFASYLSDDTPGVNDGDAIYYAPREDAARCLMAMNLPGAPPEVPGETGDAFVQKWRAWWTANKDKYQKE